MDENILSQKRSDLFHEIGNNCDKFLSARVVTAFEKAIRRVSRNPQPLSALYVSTFIVLFSVLPGFAIVLLLEENTAFKVVGILWTAAVSASTLGAVSAYYLGCFVLNYIKDYLHDVQDINDLEDLRCYLHKLWYPDHPYWRMFLPAILWGIFASFMFSREVGAFAGVGVVAGTLIFGLNLGTGFNYLAWMIGLPKHLGKYHYVLNNMDPASSEIVSRIAHLFNKVMYIHAIYFMVTTLIVLAIGQIAYWGTPVILAFWVVLTTQFISTQSALKNIITTAKWNTLNEIQTEIRALQTSGKLMQKETTDAINRLMDLHERVRLTPNSTMNMRTSLNFFNQLMLPALGVILSYLDSILKFLHLR